MKWLLRLLALAAIVQPAYAGSLAVTPGSGATVGTGTDGTNQIPATILCGATSSAVLYATCVNQAIVNASGQLLVLATQSGSWTVAATQSGAWNITNISGTISLPTGAATAANQEVTLAGTTATSAQAIQGVTGGVAVPVSAASLPLPSGAATAANQTNVQAAAGSSSSSAIGVQGVAGGVAQAISAASLPLPTGAATSANQEVTSAGTSASSAQGVQGVTGGVAFNVNPITVSHASTTALGASLSVKASAGNLFGFNCTGIAGAAAGFCVVYNSASTPGTGALTGSLVLDFCYFDTTARGCSLGRAPTSIAYSAGIQVLVTSAASPYTYTTGTDTAAISADYQ